MAIQHRRGKYSDFDPSKLLPGELAIVLSGDPASGTGRSVYVCFETGVVKRFATYEDFETEIQNATEDVQAAFTEEIRSAINSAITAANSANTAVEAANKATAAANEAAEAANAVVLGDISKNTVTFTQAEERTLPESGEDTATLFGKIKKWLADLAKVAFSGSYDDLSNKPTLGKAAEMEVANNDTTTSEGYVADARAVNLLGEEIDETNEELDTLKSSFNELKTNIALNTYSSTLATNIASSSNSNKLYKIGNIVIFTFTFNNTEGQESGASIYTLPSGYRPKRECCFPIMVSGSGGCFNAIINSSGNVSCPNNTLSSGSYYCGTAVFVA